MKLVAIVASVGLVGCSYLPARQERIRAQGTLERISGVMLVTLTCGSRMLAGGQLCAEVVMKDGAKIRFSHVGFDSFGGTAMNVFVDEAGGFVPRIASCDGVGSPNVHREGPLGHHFRPTLIDVSDAVARYRELAKEIQFWPQCPQSWEVQDKFGANYRYCARRPGATDEPPRPANCS